MMARPIRILPAALLLFLLLSVLGAAGLPKAASAAMNTKQTSLQRIQRSVARIDREASTPEGEARVVQRLAAQLRIPEETLRARHASWSLSYGEIAMVYGFARSARRQSATLPDQIVEMRRNGMDWKAIAKEIGVSIDAVATRVRKNEPRRNQ